MAVLGRSRQIWILDEENLVTILPVDELVNKLLSKQTRRTPRTNPLLFAYRNVADWIVGRVGDRRMGDFVKRKAGTGIL